MVATSKSVCSQAMSQDSKQEASTEELDPCVEGGCSSPSWCPLVEAGEAFLLQLCAGLSVCPGMSLPGWPHPLHGIPLQICCCCP